MHQQLKIVGYQLLSNAEVELHNDKQVNHLVKKGIIDQSVFACNTQLKEFLAQSNRVSNKEEYNVYFKKFMKELSKMDQLQDQDKIYLLNNSFASQAELILKVPNCSTLSAKDKKAVLQICKR